jgi:predicted tellurium resistance membrane protein TerC
MTELLVALVTLTVLEVVLGVDNIIFISILSAKLPKAVQKRARRIGLLGAMITRILLLLSLNWIANLTEPFVVLFGRGISGRDIILIGGGLFLLGKATYEIHDKLEGSEHGPTRQAASFASVITQVMILDIVFSLDSVITAVGMANVLWVMVTAIVLAVLLMLIATEPISAFVDVHPTIKILALSFLLLIGLSLIADGFGQHIDKRYIYFAMGFSVFVEMINIRIRGRAHPVHLHASIEDK